MSSLNVNVFRGSVVTQPLAVSVGCVATCGDEVLLVGTTDGKIAVYRLLCGTSGTWEAQLMHLYSAKHPQPYLSLLPLQDKAVLFTATADALAVHRLSLPQLMKAAVTNSESGDELLPQLSAVSGLKDAVMCGARRYKGSLLLAVLLRRKVLIYHYAEDARGGALVLYRESATLPDGPRCLAWSSKGVLVALRKEYFLLHIPPVSAATGAAGGSSGVASSQQHGHAAAVPLEAVCSMGKSNAPFALSTDPVPEVLLGVDGAFCRALPDGSLIDGGALPWTGGGASTPLPQLSVYSHPYLLAGQQQQQHAGGGGQRTKLEVYLPLAASSAPSTSAAASAWCQTLPVQVRYLSGNGLADLDALLPTKATRVDPSRPRDLIVAIDDTNRVHVLCAEPAAEQARAFAQAGHYGVSELVCQLSPHQVPAPVRTFVVTLQAASDFSQGSYGTALQRLREVEAPPLLAVHLCGPLLLSPMVRKVYSPSGALESLVAKCAARLEQGGAAEREVAWSALMQYLLAQRLQLRGRATTAGDEDVLKCVDTVLLQVMALLERDEAVFDLVREVNWCDVEVCAGFLQAHRRWVALAALWRATEQHERALNLLAALAATGEADGPLGASENIAIRPPPLPKEVLDALQRLAAAKYAVGDALTPLPALVLTLQEVAAPAVLRDPPLTQAVALLTMLSYLRGLSLAHATHRRLFEQYAPWLLRSLPNTQLSLSIFTSSANRRLFREALAIIQGSFRGETAAGGVISRLAVVTDFQALVLSDSQLAPPPPQAAESLTKDDAAQLAAVPTGGDLADIHAAYWQNLALLVFGGADGDTTPVEVRRQQLDRFLSQSPYVDCEAAEAFFDDAEVRGASCPERAIVYRRLGSHNKALDMLLDECDDLEGAKAYCTVARNEGGGDEAYLVLFRKLFQRGTGPRMQEALELLRSSEGGSAQSVLPMLPEDLPVRDIKDFLVNSLRQSASASHAASFQAAVLAAQEWQLTGLMASEESKGVLIMDEPNSHVCAVCHKRLRPETTFLYFPNGVVTHVGCTEDRRVCPVTGAEFRLGIMPALLKKL